MRRLPLLRPSATAGTVSARRRVSALVAAGLVTLVAGAVASGSGTRQHRQEFLPLAPSAAAYFRFEHRGWTCVSTRWMAICSRATSPDAREIERLRQPGSCTLWLERGTDVDHLTRTRIAAC